MNIFSIFKRNTIFFFKKKINVDNDKFKKKIGLDNLFINYGTDKSSKSHNFSKFYTRHLNGIKNKKINILEIGAAGGASAASFIHYFKKSRVFCIDVNLTLVVYKSKKINYFGLDSSNEKMLSKFIKKISQNFSVNKFHIIIDDGSHLLSDQLFSLNYFYKYLTNSGYYIIEDYKFSNYFKRNKNVNELTLDKLIDKLNKNKKIKSKILNEETIRELRKSKIFCYKGKSKISDIAFLRKK